MAFYSVKENIINIDHTTLLSKNCHRVVQFLFLYANVKSTDLSVEGCFIGLEKEMDI